MGLDEAALALPGELGPSAFLRRGTIDYFPDSSLLPSIRGGKSISLSFANMDLGSLTVPSGFAGEGMEDVASFLELYLHRHVVEISLDRYLGRKLIIEGRHPLIQTLCKRMEQYAPLNAPVLITGEDGVGKDILAKMIHVRSPLRERPFIQFNCPAYKGRDDMIHKLLGYREKDGFVLSGALMKTKGGTLFIEEICDLPFNAQSALARAFEENQVLPMGAEDPVKVEGRLISSTRMDLLKMVEEGQFRKDLFYHISTFQIAVPPLRDHKEDIPFLSEQIIHHFAKKNNLPYKRLSDRALEYMMGYPFEGNLKELEVVVKRALVHAPGREIEPHDIELQTPHSRELTPNTCYNRMVEEGKSFWEAVKTPYLNRKINKEELWQIVHRGLQETEGTYRDLLPLFNMVESDYKKFISFLNRNK